MLEYGASTESRDKRGWKPIDYALIRQDKHIIAAFEDIRSTPDWDTNADPTDNPFQSLILPGIAALASFGHAPLAMVLSRRRMIMRENFLVDDDVDDEVGDKHE